MRFICTAQAYEIMYGATLSTIDESPTHQDVRWARQQHSQQIQPWEPSPLYHSSANLPPKHNNHPLIPHPDQPLPIRTPTHLRSRKMRVLVRQGSGRTRRVLGQQSSHRIVGRRAHVRRARRDRCRGVLGGGSGGAGVIGVESCVIIVSE